MSNLGISRLVRRGKIKTVHCNMVKVNTACSESFDYYLSKLVIAIQAICPQAYFGANMCTDRYWFDFQSVPKGSLSKISDLLQNSQISIATRYHFDDLC